VRGDNVFSFVNISQLGTDYSMVITFATPTGEDNPFGCRPNKRGDLRSGTFSIGIVAGRITKMLPLIGEHGIPHIRVYRGGSIVVQIYRFTITRPHSTSALSLQEGKLGHA